MELDYAFFFFFTEFAVKEFGQSRQQADTTF
jgi:hypothetical protein